MARMRLVHILPCRAGCADGQLAELFPLPEVLDLSVDEVPKAFEIETSLRSRAHENVTPDARSSHGIINGQLHRAMEPNHLLHEVVWAWVYGIRPCNANGKPPAKGL